LYENSFIIRTWGCFVATVIGERRLKIQPQVQIAVLQYSAYVSGAISLGMVIALILSVIAGMYTQRPTDNTVVIALVTSLGSGLTNGLSNMALLFSHNQQSGAELGRGIVAAATEAQGLPVKDAEEQKGEV
jgi:hypothetical protein